MGVQIFFSELSNASIPNVTDLIPLVSDERQQQFNELKIDTDYKLRLYSELFLRSQICKQLGILNREIIFIKNKHGKPLLQYQPQFHFNISHSQKAFVVVFSQKNIGIDIEYMKTPNLRIATRFFSQNEQSYVFSHKNKTVSFYEILTKKEAYIKYLGTGLSTPLKSFNVLSLKKSLQIYSVISGKYTISLCGKEVLDKPLHIITLSENELLASFTDIIN